MKNGIIWHAVVGVAGARRDPRRDRARLADALLEDLALAVLAVVHHLVVIDRLVELALRGVDAELAEQALHAEGARLVRHDRHDARAELRVAQQRGQDAHERHRGRDLAIARALEQRREDLERRDLERLRASARRAGR